MIINLPSETNDAPQDQDGYKKRAYFTITEVCGFSRCPRHYFYKSGLGLRGTAEGLARRNTAAHFGTALGYALPTYLATFDFDQAYGEFLRIWGDHPGDEVRNPLKAKLMIVNFAQWHPVHGGLYKIKEPDDWAKLIRMENKSPWEIPFRIEIPGIPLPIIGSMDWGAEWSTDHTDWVCEAKTSVEMSQRFKFGFKRNPQGLTYVLARRIQGYDCKGYIHELLSTAKNPKETAAVVPFHVTDHDLNLHIGWLREQCNRILDCERQGIWPQWPTGCGTYPMFGQPGYFCEYDNLCSVPDYRDMLQFYEVKRHEPYVLLTKSGEQIVGMPKGSNAEE